MTFSANPFTPVKKSSTLLAAALAACFAGGALALLIYAINFNLIGVGESWLSHGVVGGGVGLWWVHGLFLLFGAGLLLHYYAASHGIHLLRRVLRRSAA